jgi:hypothetical protein
LATISAGLEVALQWPVLLLLARTPRSATARRRYSSYAPTSMAFERLGASIAAASCAQELAELD